MLIKKIKLENIRSYSFQEIEFPKGSILLSGDIGTGKTSVLLAIEFALFGLQPGQRGNSLLKNGEKEAKVSLEVEIEGSPIKIERTLQKEGKSITQGQVSISDANGKTEGSVIEIKNRILKLLNYPSEFAKKTNLLYKFTVYTPQEEMKQIILESPETRLNTLRHIFGIDKYKRIEENADIFTSKLREDIRAKEIQLSDVEIIKVNLQNKKDSLSVLQKNKEKEEQFLNERIARRKIIEDESKELENKIKEKENLEKEKEKAAFVLLNKKELFIELRLQAEKIAKETEERKNLIFNENKYQEIKNSISNLKGQESSLQEQIINFSSKLNSFYSKKEEAEQLNEKISKLKICPSCLQEVNENYKENLLRKINVELNELKKNIEETEVQKKISADALSKLKSQISQLDSDCSEEEIKKIKLENLREKEKNFNELLKKKQQTEMDIEMIEKHISALGDSVLSFEKFSFLYKEKRAELEKAVQEERKQDIKIAEINKEASMLKVQISEIELNLQEKKILKEKLDNLKILEGWISGKFLNFILGAEKNVMLKLREEFSKLFSEWFSILVPEPLSVKLDEEFTPIIEQQDYEISYSYLSGGERTAVALAYRLALNQVINSLLSKIKTKDIIILDEPTDGFSETQLDKMRDVLLQLKVAQLILVSHEAKIESFVENIIRFKKEDGITKIDGK